MTTHRKFIAAPILCGMLFLLSQTACAQTPAGKNGRLLVWSDEFDRDGLPDSSKWSYETGFVRNNEAQYYTYARRENARVENGCLVIEGRKESYPNAAYHAGSSDWREKAGSSSYTSACLITRGKAAWKYGRIEVRARIPHGLGVWPAIWMLGDNEQQVGWPACGEIDIMEFVGHDPTHIHGTIHYAGPVDKKHASAGAEISDPHPYDDFHVYAIEWDSARIDIYYDDKKYNSFLLDKAGKGTDNPFRKPQYLLLNLALGGSWGREIDDAIFPQSFLIDYVRVYR
ncbi:glycoside hydrolase family 16 protein [Compostibacter hankyongensis]|uniref:GH16 domain-containing protein n=1 Tax=Compostibacter hankyongensis TaxID=1007089 RepID=A0ABP8FK70_9BACT